ncbi:hypothetical protein GWI33_023348 [Rhynchophorus ferrugineus]|uniref:Uncharacterized protein n=1 Tax=Rhynchophorus ferrugineus TaxID=354439 RepID=A0A834MIH0_RHYFE|nr:hypothetical protein GWI33_023348 [Rhynchophorus ferrugineus]
MTTGETDNEIIDTGKSDTNANSDSEGEFQPVRRKKNGQRRLKSTTTTDEESNQNSSIKQHAKRQAVDQNRGESALNSLCISNIAVASTSSSAIPQINATRNYKLLQLNLMTFTFQLQLAPKKPRVIIFCDRSPENVYYGR